ncbi:hypothetical protein G646_gp057 [Serratia phage phiMAM1]|uniref:Uncharacterized protein n=2 Tax=Miltonvirus MAM1 TaxID=2169689 RepID=K7YXU8_9CAUD|nr:hypothetical protein G646_gp057 [Serratia phage phiMAM1]AFX93525.1 hypothetical protein MAM_057 [Serratia phage phiMAM1]ASZ78828.1 hypothetical protein 2050H1_062 [Serratia phage 2050H1]
MSIKAIVEAIEAGDTVTAEAELVNQLNVRREAIVEEGRQFIMASIEESVNGAAEPDAQ